MRSKHAYVRWIGSGDDWATTFAGSAQYHKKWSRGCIYMILRVWYFWVNDDSVAATQDRCEQQRQKNLCLSRHGLQDLKNRGTKTKKESWNWFGTVSPNSVKSIPNLPFMYRGNTTLPLTRILRTKLLHLLADPGDWQWNSLLNTMSVQANIVNKSTPESQIIITLLFAKWNIKARKDLSVCKASPNIPVERLSWYWAQKSRKTVCRSPPGRDYSDPPGTKDLRLASCSILIGLEMEFRPKILYKYFNWLIFELLNFDWLKIGHAKILVTVDNRHM